MVGMVVKKWDITVSFLANSFPNGSLLVLMLLLDRTKTFIMQSYLSYRLTLRNAP